MVSVNELPLASGAIFGDFTLWGSQLTNFPVFDPQIDSAA